MTAKAGPDTLGSQQIEPSSLSGSAIEAAGSLSGSNLRSEGSHPQSAARQNKPDPILFDALPLRWDHGEFN
jgi:hypothetical protein